MKRVKMIIILALFLLIGDMQIQAKVLEWDKISLPTTPEGNTFIYGNGRFIGGKRFLMTSNDGKVWYKAHGSEGESYNTEFKDVFWTGDEYIALSNYDFYKSKDGLTWVKPSFPEGTYDSLAYNEKMFIVVCRNKDKYDVVINNKTSKWERVFEFKSNNLAKHIIWTGQEFIIYDNKNTLMYSKDGIQWNEDTFANDKIIYTIIRDNDRALMISDKGIYEKKANQWVQIEFDGEIQYEDINWVLATLIVDDVSYVFVTYNYFETKCLVFKSGKLVELTDENYNLSQFAKNKNIICKIYSGVDTTKFLNLGDKGSEPPYIYNDGFKGIGMHSNDGVNWNIDDVKINRIKRTGMADIFLYNGIKYINAGCWGTLLVSKDAINWEQLDITEAHIYDGFTIGNKFVLCGSDGFFATSVDGVNWNIQDLKYCLYDVIWDGGKYIINALDEQKEKYYILTSEDGLHWVENSIKQKGWWDICYVGDKVIMNDNYHNRYTTNKNSLFDSIKWVKMHSRFTGADKILTLNNVFVMIDQNELLISEDGENWNVILQCDDYIKEVLHDGKQYFVFTEGPKLYRSKIENNSKKIISSWAYSEINEAIKDGIILGFKDINYQRELTRQELCYLAVGLYEKLTQEQILADHNPFSDTQNSYILKANKLGILATFDTFIRPNEKVYRKEVITMFMKTVEKAKSILENDSDNMNKELYIEDDEVSFCINKGILKGGEEHIKLNDKASLEQAIIIAKRFYRTYNAD